MSAASKPELFGGTLTFTQEGDSCSVKDLQQLEVAVEDAGGGKYMVIKTDRWAIDSVADLTALLSRVKQVWAEEWDA